MAEQKILSLQHPLVKYLTLLRKDSKIRLENCECLIIGKIMVQEIAKKKGLKTLLVQEGLGKEGIEAEKTIYVTENILQKITGLNSLDGYAAVVSLPKPCDLQECRYLLALDKIQDPGNMGTLFRTALALGWEGVILLEGGCDPFNDKALRSGKGAQFFLPFSMLDEKEFLSLIKKNSFQVLGADIDGENLSQVTLKPPCILMLGNEKRGITTNGVQKKISIPMKEDSESLNVASAGAILLYTLRSSL